MDEPERPTLDELRSQARGLPFYLIEMTPTAAWEAASAERRRKLLREHLLWQQEQEQAGVLLLAGPVDHGSVEGQGLAVIRADSRATAVALAATEPFAREGLRTNLVRSWLVNEGSVTVSVRLFDGHGDLQ